MHMNLEKMQPVSKAKIAISHRHTTTWLLSPEIAAPKWNAANNPSEPWLAMPQFAPSEMHVQHVCSRSSTFAKSFFRMLSKSPCLLAETPPMQSQCSLCSSKLRRCNNGYVFSDFSDPGYSSGAGTDRGVQSPSTRSVSRDKRLGH